MPGSLLIVEGFEPVMSSGATYNVVIVNSHSTLGRHINYLIQHLDFIVLAIHSVL